jgi:hypothetical protein
MGLIYLETSTMFLMTVYNCKMRAGLTFRSRKTMPIISLFLRDGIFWFLAVVGKSSLFLRSNFRAMSQESSIAVNPTQMLLWAVAPPTTAYLLIMWVLIIPHLPKRNAENLISSPSIV